MTSLLDDARARSWLQRRLLDWFSAHARVLPWRQNRDPYRIWVSEVMLQQTQVATVVGYFERFLEKYPDLPSLAAADLGELLRLWEGLGYYRRARDLHRAAQMMAQAGGFPSCPLTLRTYPGLGRYTTNAVLSQAFDQRLPILETNSVRVLCRLLGITDDPKTTPMQKWLWASAEILLPKTRVGDFNQALMELGALVCTPKNPDCGACPLKARCTAFRLGQQHAMPGASPRAKVEAVRVSALVLRRGSQVHLRQRPADGRWGNLWEFPHAEVTAGSDHLATARALGAAFDVGELSELATIRYAVTRFRYEMVCYQAEVGKPAGVEPWFAVGGLETLPICRPHRRLARMLASI